VHDPGGRPVRKPVMATRDLRFFDHPDAERLPDGRPRRGMSVVAALSRWLVHTSRRRDGAWMQRYEHGIPVTDLVPIPDVEPEHTGTTVHFMPETAIRALFDTTAAGLRELTTAWPSLAPALGPDHRRQQAGLNPDHRGDERSCRGRCDHATPG